MSFFQSKRFRGAWVTSLIAGLLFPFIDAALNQTAGVTYLTQVNTSFLKTALSFAALFFVFQCAWATVLHRRDVKNAQDRAS
jgi:hypothetical protein